MRDSNTPKATAITNPIARDDIKMSKPALANAEIDWVVAETKSPPTTLFATITGVPTVIASELKKPLTSSDVICFPAKTSTKTVWVCSLSRLAERIIPMPATLCEVK
jgi:hypothetical protein